MATFIGTTRLCMCCLLIGSLIPWYLGVIIAATFLYLDSKELDVKKQSAAAMMWVEERTPTPVSVVIGVFRRMVGREEQKDAQAASLMGESEQLFTPAYDASHGFGAK